LFPPVFVGGAPSTKRQYERLEGTLQREEKVLSSAAFCLQHFHRRSVETVIHIVEKAHMSKRL
jgi:hypothetical protein